MPTELIQLSITDAIATVTLNRPDKLNALNGEMLAGLDAIADELDRANDIRVVLLTGMGKAFCVGADIFEWSSLSPLEMGRRWIRDGHRIFERYARLPQPLIAVLNGYTFGGGLELALAADLRLAGAGVQLSFPEVKLGIIPGWGGTQRLPELIGKSRAKQMIFSGTRIDAALAEKGKGVHDELCEKCHSAGGSLASDDAGILAGQWIPYQEATYKDYSTGDRAQPKKMKKKMDKLDEETTKQLIHYYGSFQ